MMLDWSEEWNISFAGCGFRSIYYVGALSCILDRAPHLVHGASRICGASSGCLVAAALTVGMPIEGNKFTRGDKQLCRDILTTATEARKHTLGVFHPTFSLLRTVRDSLRDKLPADAHLRASGRLCVSLTRISDRSNVLVSEFASRDELIQVLMCSCFFPVYTGFIPPSYRGVYYMDGALSNNVPLYEQRNTIIVAPFSGESDICPREGTYNFLEVHYGNVSIQVNTGNVYRICTAFLPPKIQMLAEICQNGYLDALCFLKEKNLLRPQSVSHTEVMNGGDGRGHELVKEANQTERKNMMMKMKMKRRNSAHEDDEWLDTRVIQSFPGAVQSVLQEACRDSSRDGATWWSPLMYPLRLILYLLSILMMPVQLALLLLKRLVRSADLYRQTWRTRRPSSQQLRSGQSSDLGDPAGADQSIHMLAATRGRNSDKDLDWDMTCNLQRLPASSADAPACVRGTSNSARNRNTVRQKLCRKDCLEP